LSGTSVVQRGRRFAVVAYAGIDPKNGKQRQKWFNGFKTHREAEQFRLTLAHHPSFSGGVGPYGSPRLRTGDYLTTWHEERERLGALRVGTAKRNRQHITLHIAPNIGHIPLARLSPAVIQNLYVTLLDSGLSGSTVRRAAAVLHTALRDAVRRGLIIRNPQDNTTLPRRAQYDPIVPTPEQVVTYLDDARETATPAIWAFYVTAAATGLREGELLGLRDDAIDLDRRLLSVRQQLVRAGRDLVFGQPKTARGRRTVLLPAVAIEALRAAHRWKREQRLKLGPRFRDSGLVFCGPTGAAIHASDFYRRDHLPRLARLGLPHFRIHDFRHFHATYLTAAGVDPRTAADRLGHTDPGFFTRTYSHAVAAAQERAAAIANELLTKTAPSGW